jgi:hypothetical protein
VLGNAQERRLYGKRKKTKEVPDPESTIFACKKISYQIILEIEEKKV